MMKSFLALASYALLAPLHFATAYPGMKDTLSTLQEAASLEPRAAAKPLLGDLLTLPDSSLTSIAKDIKAILLYTKDATSNDIDTSIPVGTVDSAACKADLCCVWKWISYEMTAKFNGTSGRCSKYARGAVRLGFHDAAVWTNTSSYGGADGSILLSDEMSRSDNNGLADIAAQMNTWYTKYHPYGVSMADLIQFGANVAAVVCPLGPRIRSFVGRKDNSKAGPTGLLPAETDAADKLLKLFAAKTIDATDLVALVGAHTTSQQHFVNTSRSGDPQDSSPGVWDVAFYGEVTSTAPPRVLKFRSDVSLSGASTSSPVWKAFTGGQAAWNTAYAKSYTRLSLLGVNNINSLQECTKVLPAARTSFVNEDQVVLDMWLQGQFNQLNDMVDNAIMLTGLVSTGGKE